MKKNDYNFLTDKVFFAEELIFDVPGRKISENEIDEIDDFPGKEEFIKFYTAHNGGTFYVVHGFSQKSVIIFLLKVNHTFQWIVFL